MLTVCMLGADPGDRVAHEARRAAAGARALADCVRQLAHLANAAGACARRRVQPGRRVPGGRQRQGPRAAVSAAPLRRRIAAPGCPRWQPWRQVALPGIAKCFICSPPRVPGVGGAHGVTHVLRRSALSSNCLVYVLEWVVSCWAGCLLPVFECAFHLHTHTCTPAQSMKLSSAQMQHMQTGLMV